MRRLASVLALAALPAHAGDWSGHAGFTTDKVSRGMSVTDGQPSALLDLNYRGDAGWLGSASLSTLNDGTSTEAVFSLGWARQIDEAWQAQAGASWYAYPGSGRFDNSPYAEFYVSAGWRGRVSLLAVVSPATAFSGPYGQVADRRTRTLEVALHQRLAGRLALEAGLGHMEISGLNGYRYGSLGLSWTHGPLQLYAARIDSNAAARGLAAPRMADGRWVASVLWAF